MSPDTSLTDIIGIFTDMLEIVSRPGLWCQNASARDTEGNVDEDLLTYHADHSHDLTAALTLASSPADLRVHRYSVITQLTAALPDEFRPAPGNHSTAKCVRALIKWNDAPGRCQNDVVRLVSMGHDALIAQSVSPSHTRRAA
jgi:hypothetical protein